MGRKVAAFHRKQHRNSVIWQTLSDRSRLSGDGPLDLFTVHQPGTSFLLSLEITALKHRQPSDTKAPLKPAITPPCISLILNQRKKKGTCIFFLPAMSEAPAGFTFSAGEHLACASKSPLLLWAL